MGLFDTKPAPVKAVAKKAAGVVKKAAPRRQAAPDDDDDDAVDEVGDDGGVTSGWGGAKKMKSEYSDYISRLQMKEETIVMKFLDDGPYANVATHWVGMGKTARSFQCLGSKVCPMCAIGDKPRVAYCFNIIQLTDEGPIRWSWDVGVRLFNTIEKKSQSTRFGPLSKSWYTLQREGLKKDDTVYNLNVVKKESDIDDPDFYINGNPVHIPTAAEMKAVKPYTKADAIKGRPTLKAMQELAAAQTGEPVDEDDEDE